VCSAALHMSIELADCVVQCITWQPERAVLAYVLLHALESVVPLRK